MTRASAFSVTFALALPSAANLREHHMVRAKRAKAQRAAAAWECQRAKLIPLPVAVLLTRIGYRSLDDDNLAHAFKAVRDGVADAMGIKDNDPRVRWAYAQAPRGKAGIDKVRIDIAGSVQP